MVAQALGQALYSSGNYLEDTQVVPIGPTTFRVTRRFVPQWAIVVAVIGVFCFALGLLALLVRDTEELTIDIQPDPEGSRIQASGKAKGAIVMTVQSVLARFEGYAPPMNQTAPQGPPLSPDGNYWWDGTQWQPVNRGGPPVLP